MTILSFDIRGNPAPGVPAVIAGNGGTPTALRFDQETLGDSDTYTLDFSTWLAVVPGDSIVSALVTVTPGGMTIHGTPTIAGGLVSQVLSGGTLNTDYTVSYHITTALGRVATRGAMLFCGVRANAVSIVSRLGARVLRKLGVAIVADVSRPGPAVPVSAQDVALDMLVQMGIPVPFANQPTPGPTIASAEIAARALRAVGVNPIAGVAAPVGTIAVAEIAARALRVVGVNPAGVLGGIASGVTMTVFQVADAALLKLAVVAPDEAPSDHDHAEAVNRAFAVHDMLAAEAFVTWSGASIPDAAAEFYIIMVANLLAPEFGKPASADAYTLAKEALRELALTGSIAQARAESWVAAVHGRLTIEALADWPVTAIPEALGEAYVAMVAALLAPVHGKPADPAAAANGEAAVRRVVLAGPRGQALAADKVAAVHEELRGLGLVRWPLSAVPGARVEAYVEMARILLCPIFKPETPDEIQANAAQYAAGIASVRRGELLFGVEARAVDRVGSVHEELNALGLVTWDVSAIPAALMDTYSALAASKMVAEGGKPLTIVEYGAWVQRVRVIAMGGAAGQALAEQKVRAAQVSLEARGQARWTLFDVPVWAEEPLVLMAAVLLGPEVGQKVDPNWSVVAERDLWRITSVPSNREPVRAEYF